MVKQQYGRIVNQSSSSALGNRGQLNYSTAKAGLQGFTKTVAIELGPFGITANAVAPGFIATDMTAATADRMGISMMWPTPSRSSSAKAQASSPARSSA
jgi:3-oxoacyl-[acyl-carrier protein] reductase